MFFFQWLFRIFLDDNGGGGDFDDDEPLIRANHFMETQMYGADAMQGLLKMI